MSTFCLLHLHLQNNKFIKLKLTLSDEKADILHAFSHLKITL